MKTLIRKELRENFVVAVVGFGILTFLVVQAYRGSTEIFAHLALGQTGWYDNNSVQPLLAVSLLKDTGLFCAIFGAILGWLQIHNERHRDLWGFLIHRPLPRTEIFFGKVIAGLSLYTLGAGLPLAGLTVMTRIPGHIAAPFEWAMLLPVIAWFLTGFVFYFAGLLTGVRQARWYASRGLALGLGIVVFVLVAGGPEFWRALGVTLLGGTIVATAAWGSFMSSGYYFSQPTAGRRALVTSLMLGCIVIVLFALMLVASLLPGEAFHWSIYQMTKDGVIYKMTQLAGKPLEITDLNGKPFIDTKTGRPITRTDFNYQAAWEVSVQADFQDLTQYEKQHRAGYQDNSHFFYIWRETPDTLWYWSWTGRLLGYDIASRRFIGSFGPDGFTPGLATGQAHFSRPEGREWRPYESYYYDSSYPARTLMTDTAVYRLDFENRTASVLFAATNNDHIGGALDVALRANDWDYTIVVTKGFLQLLAPDGKWIWRTPYEPAYPAYNNIGVYFLKATNRFALWLDPSYQTNRLLKWTLPSHVVWLAVGQGMLQNTNLPAISGDRGWTPYFPTILGDQEWAPPLTERSFFLAIPPSFYFVAPILAGRSLFGTFPWTELLVSLAAALGCAGIGWVMGRRYHFSVGAQLKWAGFHLLFGVPGLLAFLCVQEWPARETCPNCKKPRLVDREQCEFCGAAFAPPPRTGIEIFETIS